MGAVFAVMGCDRGVMAAMAMRNATRSAVPAARGLDQWPVIVKCGEMGKERRQAIETDERGAESSRLLPSSGTHAGI